jgi:hypothetical protein
LATPNGGPNGKYSSNVSGRAEPSGADADARVRGERRAELECVTLGGRFDTLKGLAS